MCACARESERAACARPDTTFLKWKKMYGKEIGSERATKRPKKYVSFSLSRNEEEKDDDFRSERESERERGVRDGVVCVVVSSKRALKGKETVCSSFSPKRTPPAPKISAEVNQKLRIKIP